MNHLEEKVVKFTSAVERQVIEDGVVKKYWRSNFVVDGVVGSVTSPSKLTAQIGRVRFVKKGELGPTGVAVVQDAWSLVGALSLTEVREIAAINAAEAEIAGLI